MAAVALGMVTLAGCELFDSAQRGISQLFGDADDAQVVPDPPDPDGDDRVMEPIYGGPPSVDTGMPTPDKPIEIREVPIDIQPEYGVP